MLMSGNILKAFNDADQMVKDCQNKINELKALKEIYLKLAKSQGHYNADQPETCFEVNFLKRSDIIDTSLPIRGIFSISKDYPTINSINKAIQNYERIGECWVKIRDQLNT